MFQNVGVSDLVGRINNLRSLDSTEKTSAVQVETNTIYEFVPPSICSLKEKQLPVFKGQLFVSI